MYTAEVEARTIGARIHCPAVLGGSDPQRGDKVQPGVNPAVVAEMAPFPALSFRPRQPDDEPYYRIAFLANGPTQGSVSRGRDRGTLAHCHTLPLLHGAQP